MLKFFCIPDSLTQWRWSADLQPEVERSDNRTLCLEKKQTKLTAKISTLTASVSIFKLMKSQDRQTVSWSLGQWLCRSDTTSCRRFSNTSGLPVLPAPPSFSGHALLLGESHAAACISTSPSMVNALFRLTQPCRIMRLMSASSWLFGRRGGEICRGSRVSWQQW